MSNNRRTEGIPINFLPSRTNPKSTDRLYLFGFDANGVLKDYTIEYQSLINSVRNTYRDLKFKAIINASISRGNWILDAFFIPWEINTIEYDDDLDKLTISFFDKGDGSYPNFVNKRLYIEQGANKQAFIINNSHIYGLDLVLPTTLSWTNSETLFHFRHVTNAMGSAVSDTYARPVLWYRGDSTEPTAPDVSWAEYGFMGEDLGDWVNDPSKLSGSGTVDWIAYGSYYNDAESWSGLDWIVKRASDATYALYSADGIHRESGEYPVTAAHQYVKFLISGTDWSPWIKFRGLPDEYTQIYSGKLNLTSYTDSLKVSNILPFDWRMYSSYKFIFEWVSDGNDPTTDTAVSTAILDLDFIELGDFDSVTYGYGTTVALYWSILYNGAANFSNFVTRQNTNAATGSVQYYRVNFNNASGDSASDIVGQLVFFDPGLIDEDGYVYILAK